MGGVALAAGVVLVVIGFVMEGGSTGEAKPAAFYRSRELTVSPFFTNDASISGGVLGLSGVFQ